MKKRNMQLTYIFISLFIGVGLCMLAAIKQHQSSLLSEMHMPDSSVISKVENTINVNYDNKLERIEAAQMHNNLKSWTETIQSHKFVIAMYGAALTTFMFMFVHINYLASNNLENKETK